MKTYKFAPFILVAVIALGASFLSYNRATADWGPSVDLLVRVYEGNPANNVRAAGVNLLMVADDRSNPSHGARGTTGSDGEFIFHVNTGGYNLEMRSPNYQGQDFHLDISADTVFDAALNRISPTPTPTPTADCNNPGSFLTGQITDNGENSFVATGLIQNNSSNCTVQVGMASYKLFHQGPDPLSDQVLFESTTTNIGPNQSLNLNIRVPDCHYQVDLFWGGVRVPPDYGSVNLAFAFGHDNLCSNPTPTSTSTPTPTPFVNLNFFVKDVCTNAPVVGGTVSIDRNFGNGVTRNTDGSGFANFGVFSNTNIGWSVSAGGFANSNGNVNSGLSGQTVNVSLQRPCPTLTPTPTPTPVPTPTPTPTPTPNPSLISADIKCNGIDGPCTIPFGGLVNISWTSRFATACFVAPTGWTGISGVRPDVLFGQRTYTLTCNDNVGNSVSDAVTVFVVSPTPTPTPTPTGTVPPNPIIIEPTPTPGQCTFGTLVVNSNNNGVGYAINGPSGTINANGNHTFTNQATGTYTINVNGSNNVVVAPTTNVLACNSTVIFNISVITPTPTPAPVAIITGNLDIQKLGRNITRGETSERTSVGASSNDTIEFEVHVRALNGSASNVVVNDLLPAGLTYVSNTTSVNGNIVSNGITGSGINIGSLAQNQEEIVRLSATVDPVPAGQSRTLINVSQVRADNIATSNSNQVSVVINQGVVLGALNVKTGGSSALYIAMVTGFLSTYTFWFYKVRMV